MKICAEHDVLLILPSRTYDFNDENDRFLFTIECQVAARENELRTKLMTDAKRRKAMRGEYDGRTIPVGFIVDRDKQSPTFGHFIVYEPHARVVRRLYRRYRELGGWFNLLANEVASMVVVFPEFEAWINPLDVSKMLLKRVPGGYHINKSSLHKLLMAVEYMGYWKVDGVVLTDEQGEPLQTHQAIVDQETWQYSFNRLSHVTLQGEINLDRIDTRAHWTTGKATDKPGGLLQGILTSTQGNVRYSSGKYTVAEHREGHSQWSNTLVVNALYIDALFSARLSERLLEMQDMGKGDFLQQQLAQMEQRNKTALVSVDEQIKGYKQKIANIQAYIAAVGASADKKTLLDYNEQILDARANLDALEAKKHTAKVKESSMRELMKRIQKLTGADCFCSTETSRNFIELACEHVSLDEYSSHFVTLTIVWKAPFVQTDVCYIHREDGSKIEWTEADEYELAMLYPLVDRKAILERFPMRSWIGIMTWAKDQGMERYTRVNTSEIANRKLSLRDHELLQTNGWTLDETIDGTDIKAKKHHYWLYNTSASDTLTSSSGQQPHF
jgi:hypothetical protein